MALLGGCYGVASWLLLCYFGVARWLLCVAMLLLIVFPWCC